MERLSYKKARLYHVIFTPVKLRSHICLLLTDVGTQLTVYQFFGSGAVPTLM